MSAIDLIKGGILKNDMCLVAEGFYQMTGQKVLVDEYKQEEAIVVEEDKPKKARKPRKKKEVIVEVKEEAVKTTSTEDFHMQIRDPNKSRIRDDGKLNARREPIDTRKIGSFNLFQDDGNEAVEDKQFDKNVKRVPPVKRRKAPKKVNATCTHCQKEYEVYPIHQFEGSFTCDRCVRKKANV